MIEKLKKGQKELEKLRRMDEEEKGEQELLKKKAKRLEREKRLKEHEERKKEEEAKRREFLMREREAELRRLKLKQEKKELKKEKKEPKLRWKKRRKVEEEIEEAIEEVKKEKAGIIGIRKKEAPERKVPAIVVKEKVITEKPKKFDTVGFIKKRIYDARDALSELDFVRARHVYVEVMGAYKELNDKDKAKVYEEIKELYEDRKHAESMFERK